MIEIIAASEDQRRRQHQPTGGKGTATPHQRILGMQQKLGSGLGHNQPTSSQLRDLPEWSEEVTGNPEDPQAPAFAKTFT